MYAQFVDMVKQELRPKMTPEQVNEALKKVINYCIDKGILKEFLEKHSTEVRNMLFTKWNWKDYVTVQKEELREELEAKYQAQLQEEQERNRQAQERIRQQDEEIRRLRASK
jgi:hypothetical protein